PEVKTRWDEKFLYVESNGLPSHGMMVGITAWQQQVPLPQNYTGANAWRVPLAPVPAKEPATIRGRFLRGAIAIAANGIPIFNPQNNRGEISLDIGELDKWGGHCGRADDYHYHVAPLHLQSVTGPALPIAYALDGYPVYGLTEPDGSEPRGLDALNGHHTSALGYHYHASKKYPFVMGGFHGEVTERDGQVDPQPRATPVREALQALRGAQITAFEKQDGDARRLTYTMGKETGTVSYAPLPDGGGYRFRFRQGSAEETTEIYTPRQGGGGKGAPGRERASAGQPRPPVDGARPRDVGLADSAVSERNFPPRSSDGVFFLSSPVVEDGAELPAENTGDGRGSSPPLVWKGAPSATRSYALVMDHLDAKGGWKGYWIVYDIPSATTSFAAGVSGPGRVGVGFRGQLGYEPPKSQGPGSKTYVITLYALSAPLSLGNPSSVNRDTLLAAIQGKVLASSSLRVVHARPVGGATAAPKEAPKEPRQAAALIKPAMSDTVKLNIYADNWFMLYVNGRLVAVDPIPFTPHNVVSVDFLPEYPMTIAVLAKDNADPVTGLEYGDRIGDGGFILKFADGTVTNATWRAKCFSRGPIGGDVKNPRVASEPLPQNWWAADFDDSRWPQAKEYSAAVVDPKSPYYEYDFKNAEFIWTDDLAIDNTVVFRTRVEKPGWTPRWNTRPDLEAGGLSP
ncbi:MAG: hypothetical protein RLZZ50_653, partial [Verrucomicrobiota bacterium]